MYKEDLALNNLQWLICREAKPNQTKIFIGIIHMPSLTWIVKVWKSYELRIVTWSFNCLQRIMIYDLKPYNCRKYRKAYN